MKFNYKARTKEGELQVGNVDASSKDAALNILLNHGLFVLNVESETGEMWYDRILGFFKRVKVSDMMVFTRQFATLLASQITLSDSLSSLYKQTTNPILKEAIYEIANDIDAGFSLSQGLARHPEIFSEFYVNMVKSSEVTGRMSEVLEFLADYLEKQSLLKSKIKNAVSYPIFVVILFFVVILIMVTFVFPQIVPIFEESNIEMPFLTKIILSSGMFIGDWWWAIGIAFVLFMLVLIDYFRSEEGKVVYDEISLRLPVVGKLFQKLYIARFAESTRVLIRGGLTIPQAVEISSRTVGSKVYGDLLNSAAEQIRKGKLLSKILEGMPEFPPLVSQLITIGESTGRMEELLKKVNDFYTREIEDMVNNLVTLIQPILMLVIGLGVALLFMAVLMPLYTLTQSF